MTPHERTASAPCLQGQVAVLGWDTRRLAPVTTSLHSFSPTQLPTRGRTLFPCPPVARMEPSGRAVAILLYQSIIAVLPAVSPGVKQSVMTPHATATVGNSFVIDLTQHGIRSARDFTFLRECAPTATLLTRTPAVSVVVLSYSLTSVDVRLMISSEPVTNGDIEYPHTF